MEFIIAPSQIADLTIMISISSYLSAIVRLAKVTSICLMLVEYIITMDEVINPSSSNQVIRSSLYSQKFKKVKV